jgi:hypothetical protein
VTRKQNVGKIEGVLEAESRETGATKKRLKCHLHGTSYRSLNEA